MQVLLTGAAGFIGSATAQELAKRGHRVFAIDNFSPYYARSLKKLRVQTFLTHPLIEFRQCDLTNIKDIQSIFKQEKVTAVLHLAAQAGVRVPISRWRDYSRDNLDAFSNILIAAAECGISDFLYASSSSIYGTAKHESLSESEVVPSPLSFYGATKLANEIIANTTAKATGIKTRGLRYFTVYGPWGRPDMVYFRMIASAITKEPFDFFGDGSIERDFTYIGDVAKMNCELLEEIQGQEESFTDVVNIGGGKPRSINQILGIVKEVSGLEVPFIRRERNTSDVSRTKADYSYLESLIEQHPTIPAEEGLRLTFEWASRPAIEKFLSKWVKSTP